MDDLGAKTACVIGAGTMGSGIAAHLANLGFKVTLLDQTYEAAAHGFDKAKRVRPPHLYLPDLADRITLAGIDTAPDQISTADWVCEAIVERLDAKQALFETIEPLLRPDAFISTNTSGLQISLLADGRSEDFRRRLIGTHFFNPPRYLKLLELIPTLDTDLAECERLRLFMEEHVGRRVVVAKDTPGFIANRFGMWAMFHAIHTAEKLQLSIEQVDAVTGAFLGRPRSGSFRLNDLVGLDVMADIASNLISRCTDDPHRDALRTPRSLGELLSRGWLGEKSGQGYYRKEGRELLALDLQTIAYRMRQDIRFASLEALMERPLGERVAAGLDLRDEAGEFLREHLVPVLQYADYLKDRISHSVLDFDRVMRWGFGWQMGPFQLIDAIGPERLGISSGPFYQGASIRSFSGEWQPCPEEPQYRQLGDFPVVEAGEGFRVRDLDDGVLAIALTSKMGVLRPAIVRELTEYLGGANSRLVLTGEGRSFSAGYDINFFLEAIAADQWEEITAALQDLQQLSMLLSKTASVAAVYGYALGGGFELALGCSSIVADAEAKIGLPESRVGLIPAGTGASRMRVRNQVSAKALALAVRTLTLGSISGSAEEARRLGYLGPQDVICFHPDRLLTDAKAMALNAVINDPPVWTTPEGPIGGMVDRQQQEMRSRGEMTEYDETIGDKLKAIFCKTGSWEEAIERERREFSDLMHRALTQARMRHMLETGKPLSN